MTIVLSLTRGSDKQTQIGGSGEKFRRNRKRKRSKPMRKPISKPMMVSKPMMMVSRRKMMTVMMNLNLLCQDVTVTSQSVKNDNDGD